jgi:hypothetical protein
MILDVSHEHMIAMLRGYGAFWVYDNPDFKNYVEYDGNQHNESWRWKITELEKLSPSSLYLLLTILIEARDKYLKDHPGGYKWWNQ